MKKLFSFLFLTTLFFSLFIITLIAGIGVGESTYGALPVELTSFTAKVVGNTIELNWITGTEVNNYGFEVERSSNITLGGWERIGFVEGQGNSNSPKEYSFTDSPKGGSKFSYRLKQIDTDGKYAYSNVINIEINLPIEVRLNQNYPNPFNPSTNISYSISKSSRVVLSVYDVLGNLVTTLVNENQEIGSYTINFNAGELSSGIYYYKLQVGDFVAVKKMLLLK